MIASVLPLLDGVTEWPVDGSGHGEAAANLVALQALLERHCVIERGDPPFDPLARQQQFFTFCGDPEAAEKLKAAQVLIVGSEPWTVSAAQQLAASGIGSLHLSADGQSGWMHDGAIVDRIAATTPGCHLTVGAGHEHGRWSLVIGGLPALAISRQQALSRFVLSGVYDAFFVAQHGVETHFGPAIVGGQPPCWECCRHRLLANAKEPWAAHRVHRRAVQGPGLDGQRAAPVPADGLIGHTVAMMALQRLGASRSGAIRGQLLIQNMLTFAMTHHTIVPLPWCEICGGAAAQSDANPIRWDEIASSDADLPVAAFAQGFIDARTGITPDIRARLRNASRGSLPVTANGYLSAFSDATNASAMVRRYIGPIETFGGKGMTYGEARVGALAEGFERYSASRFRLNELRLARLDELPGDILDPQRVALYEDVQLDRPGFPFKSLDAGRALHWKAGYWADSGMPVWVPARLSYYAEIDEPFVQVTSNGLAAGQSLEDASLRALFELVERDAFMITWLCRLPARRIELVDAFEPQVQDVIRALMSLGAEIRLYALDAGLELPVVLCLALGDGKTWPGLTIALGAHRSLRRAIRSAVLEQAYSGPFIRETAQAGKQPVPQEQTEVTTFLGHALYYVPPSRANAFAFLDVHDLPPLDLAEMPEDEPDSSLSRCAARLRELGFRIAIVDVTSPDVATTGLRVVRAVSEDLQPLHCGYGLERSQNARLSRFAHGPLNRNVHPMC